MTVLNWEFIQQYLPLYEKAAWLTLRLGVMGILLSIAVGLACAVIQYEKIPVLRRVVAVYIEISRNTPLLIQLFFLYYGLPKIGIRTSPAMCGVAGLAFLGGSYMAEAFRSGLEAVEPIQRESAFSLGMTRTQAMAYVVLPQAVKNILPALCNEFISTVKGTSLASVFFVGELMTSFKTVQSATFLALQSLTIVGIIYFLLNFILSRLLRVIERRLTVSD